MKTDPLMERFVQQSIVKGVCVALCSQQRRDAQKRSEDADSAAPNLFSIIIGRDFMVRNRTANNSGLHTASLPRPLFSTFTYANEAEDGGVSSAHVQAGGIPLVQRPRRGNI